MAPGESRSLCGIVYFFKKIKLVVIPCGFYCMPAPADLVRVGNVAIFFAQMVVATAIDSSL
jgi:hypothetical protein